MGTRASMFVTVLISVGIALEHAARHDASMRVRRKAIRTLRQNRLAATGRR